MEELVKWYWEHGVKRGSDPNDPERGLRKISVGGWLDPIVRIIERNKAIHTNVNNKACLALWGPSQAGKSTMMSRYIDGMSLDGSDSALTWSYEHKTRFSPPMEGADYLKSIYPDTLIFNPYNFGSDASGVATRYTLQKESDGGVNPEFPIEIRLTTRAQLIQSYSLGYFSECSRVEENFVYNKESFLEELSGGVENGTPSPEAYSLLKDIADVIEFMKGEDRFSNLFKQQGKWDSEIRPRLVSSSKLCSSVEAAEKFMAKIFWDSSEVLTRYYRETERMLMQLQSEWEGCKVLASLEVGALLVDIASFKCYVSPENANAEKIRERVSQLSYEKNGNEIHIILRAGGSKISGEAFGYFQAACAEIKVPLKQEILEADPSKVVFLELAKKCDFLDFPGVSNKAVVANAAKDDVELTDLAKATPKDIFTRVFKQGKTQCFVYGYAKKYGIDAFSVLVRTANFPSKASLLNAGVREWLCSFDSSWLPGRSAEMPVFVNMTFFAKLINAVAMAGTNNGLNPIVEQIYDLTFARKESATFFATTYHQFTDGKIDSMVHQETTVDSVMQDPSFTSSTGLTKENIDAVFSGDGGVDYMFRQMNQRISTTRRLDRCRCILDKDRVELLRMIQAQLPADADSMADERKNKLRECRMAIENALSKIEEDKDTAKYRELAGVIKNLFAVSFEVFDPVPVNAVNMSKKEINAYVKAQIGNWYTNKIAKIEPSEFLTVEQMQTIFVALKDSISEEDLFEFINESLGQIDNNTLAAAARYPFSLTLGNLLWKGGIYAESEATLGERNPVILDKFIQTTLDKASDREGSPYYHAIIAPALDRMEELATTSRAGARPPQAGDDELKAIFARIENSQAFQI